MHTVTLDEAQSHLPELIEAASAGEEVIITKKDGTSIQLVLREGKKRIRLFGSAKGLISMNPNFDEPLEDFKDYME